MNSHNDCQAIVELDLDPIKLKLMHKESGEGWTLEQASAVEIEYRRFLYLAMRFPKETLSPSEEVDTFWHYHILDTMKYARDCEDLFGYFLHHFPYSGLHGEDDLAAREEKGERMAVLYEETFGEKYGSGVAATAKIKAAFCFMTDPGGGGISARTGTVADATAPFTASAPKAKAAFCFMTDPSGGGISARASKPAPEAKTAFCFMTDPGGGTISGTPSTPEPKAETAFCFATDPGGGISAHASTRTPKGKAAFCFATDPISSGISTRANTFADTNTAFCFTTAPAGGAISMDPAKTVADDILMNKFFLARPQPAA